MNLFEVILQIRLTGKLEFTKHTGKGPFEKMNSVNVVGKGVFPSKLSCTHFTFVFLFLFMNSFDVAFEI